MKAKSQRLVLVILAVAAMAGSAMLAMSALREQASYFRSPEDVARDRPAAGQAFRLGGMVKPGSWQRNADGVSGSFIATDGQAELQVRYTGPLPDLFKEGSGMVADGQLAPDGAFVANKRNGILAKHDERYMPPQMEGKLHKTGKVS